MAAAPSSPSCHCHGFGSFLHFLPPCPSLLQPSRFLCFFILSFLSSWRLQELIPGLTDSPGHVDVTLSKDFDQQLEGFDAYLEELFPLRHGGGGAGAPPSQPPSDGNGSGTTGARGPTPRQEDPSVDEAPPGEGNGSRETSGESKDKGKGKGKGKGTDEKAAEDADGASSSVEAQAEAAGTVDAGSGSTDDNEGRKGDEGSSRNAESPMKGKALPEAGTGGAPGKPATAARSPSDNGNEDAQPRQEVKGGDSQAKDGDMEGREAATPLVAIEK